MILLRIYPFKMYQMKKRMIKNERMVFKVKKHYTDEKTGISYTMHGDVYLPNLVYSEHKYPPLGKYGMLRQTYLKEYHKLLYSRMLMNDSFILEFYSSFCLFEKNRNRFRLLRKNRQTTIIITKKRLTFTP